MPVPPKSAKSISNNSHTEIRRAYALHKKEAIIHTASIDVKIMRLEGKQLTLSTFRQLLEENIIEETSTAEVGFRIGLRGIPWGRVEYTWDKCHPWVDYHIVWQKGSELRRMPLPRVSNLKEEIQEGTIQDYGCPICDISSDKCTSKYDANMCHCGARLRSYKSKWYTDYGSKFLCWMFPDWPEYCEDREEDKVIKQQLEEFESLEQLFIAV